MRVAVPSPLSVNVTPLGKAPFSVRLGVGEPVVVTVKVLAAPTVKVVLLALVMIAGAWLTVSWVVPVTPLSVALMIEDPGATALANPAAVMVATEVVAEAQVTWLVRSLVE